MKICGLILLAILFIASYGSCLNDYYFNLNEELICYIIPIISCVCFFAIILTYIKEILKCCCDVFNILTCFYFKKDRNDNEIPYRQYV